MQVHGGGIYAFNRQILDFSASINPLGVPQSVISAVKDSIKDIDKYPDDDCTLLTSAIAEKKGVSTENVICGGGAEELIYAVMQALKPKTVLVLQPTFSEYERAALTVDAQIIKYPLDEKNGFALDEDIINYAKRADMTVICDPNNPTGKQTDREVLKKITQNSRFTVIDNSFADFCTGGEQWLYNKNIIVLYSFTKIYAVPGLRLGCVICKDKEIIKKTDAAKPRWSVSVPAQAAGLAALNEEDHVKKSVGYINAEKGYLYRQFDELKIKYFVSDANFILFKSKLPLYDILLEKGILLRDCTSFGLKGFYRIAVRTHSENEKLIKELKSIIEHIPRA